jgi:hypothetical protein
VDAGDEKDDAEQGAGDEQRPGAIEVGLHGGDYIALAPPPRMVYRPV